MSTSEEVIHRLERGSYHSSTRGHLASKDDKTPEHMTYPTGYDPKCGMCWLGYGHSEAYHQQAVAS